MYVRCPSCGVTLDVRDDIARSVPQIACASCGRAVPLAATVAMPPPSPMVHPAASQPMMPMQSPAVGVAPSNNKTMLYAMLGLGGLVVVLLGAVITLMLGRGESAAVASTVPTSRIAPVTETELEPLPDDAEPLPEQPLPRASPNDLPGQVAERQREVHDLQQELLPLRQEKQRLEDEIRVLTE